MHNVENWNMPGLMIFSLSERAAYNRKQRMVDGKYFIMIASADSTTTPSDLIVDLK